MIDYKGKKVYHKAKFGEGVIVAQNDKGTITVKFSSEKELKKFTAPECFNSFLQLLDADAAEMALEETRSKAEIAKKAEKQKLNEVKARSYNKVMKARKDNGKEKKIVIPSFTSIDDFYDEQDKIIRSEIAYLRSNGGKRIKIFDGKLVEIKESGAVYSFETDSELNLPDNTQISVWLFNSDESIPGKILYCEDFTIIISIMKNLGDDIPFCEFASESWRLLNYLTDRLITLRNNRNSSIVRALVCDGRKKIQYGKEIIKGQDNACRMSMSQPITFIWGPPGTGKTKTLADLAQLHMKHGNRVLMLSYSNVSVDEAVLRVFNNDHEKTPGKIVRYGYPRKKEVIQHDHLTSYNLALKAKPEVMLERRSIIEEQKKLSRTSARYVELEKRLRDLRKKMEDEEKLLASKALFLATTVSKAVADSTVYARRFDTVIFDEASMAYIPQIIFSAGLAVKHFICIGDFAQLPPIVQSDNTSSLNADIFEFCGITEAVEAGVGHEWLCMLDTQYRMHPDISDFSSRTMYHGLLKSGEKMEAESSFITRDIPFPGKPLQLVDLSGMLSVCTSTIDRSRINVLSAMISIGLAINAAKNHEVGIITPYNAQSRLLHAFARDVADQTEELNKITCATVHQFQGSEKDVILYDAVDCYRMPFPGTMLTSLVNNYSNRLYNVAVTRAKGKMISVVNVDYMKTKELSKRLVFRNMIDTLVYDKEVTGGSDILALVDNTVLVSYNKEKGETAFLADLKNAQREIRVDMPGGTINESKWLRAFANELELAKQRGVKVTVRTDDIQNISKELQRFVIENKFIANPVSLIDKRIIWYGMPHSKADFIAEGRSLPTRYRPILRFVGRYAAQSLFGFLEMNTIIDKAEKKIENDSGETYNSFASYVAGEISCRECGGSMKLIKSKKGRFFLGCKNYPNCGYTQFVEPEMVDEYLYFNNPKGKRCPRDNKSLTAKFGQFGIYVCCCSLNEHRYRLDEI